MKRLLLGLCCALFLSSVGAFPALAQDSQPANPPHKSRWSWFHREKRHREKTENTSGSLYSVPKSVGWGHHRSPGPAGAGADLKTKKVKARREKKQHRDNKSAQLYSSPKTVGWWRRSVGPSGAGAK
jgi:hypothetical protein